MKDEPIQVEEDDAPEAPENDASVAPIYILTPDEDADSADPPARQTPVRRMIAPPPEHPL